MTAAEWSDGVKVQGTEESGAEEDAGVKRPAPFVWEGRSGPVVQQMSPALMGWESRHPPDRAKAIW
jgi:hypothetical protein